MRTDRRSLIRVSSILSALLALMFFSPAAASGLSPLAQILRPIPESRAASRALWLEAIHVTGNQRTKEKDILRHIRLCPGDTINVFILEQERLQLIATDYFTEVDFSTRPGSERGAVILVIDVVERKYPLIETGFGYHDLYGWFLTLIGLRFDHAFGYESRMRMGIRLGFHLAGIDAEWEKPTPANGGFGAGARLFIYAQRHQFYGSGPDKTVVGGGEWAGTGWRVFEQNIGRFGGEATLRYRVGEATQFSFGFKAEIVDPDSSFDDRDKDETLPYSELPGELKPAVDRTVISGFVFRMIRDTRDHPLHPTSGSFARLMMDFNSSFLGGDEIFTKAVADYRKHIHAGDGWVLSTRLNGGIISSGAPYFERFYIGGIYSIRGFKELSLSPTTGDNGCWLASEEIRWPLVASGRKPPRLTGLVFFDIGQGWKRGEILSSEDIQSAAGYGVRLRLPWIGTLGIDVGIPFTNGKTEENFRVHGSIGFSF